MLNLFYLLLNYLQTQIRFPCMKYCLLDYKEYDLVILSKVLLHILPTDIDSIIKKLIALSKKHIINIDWYEESPSKSHASHNFIHQYEQLYQKYTDASTTTIKRIPIKRKKFIGTLDTKQSYFSRYFRKESK